MVAIKKYHRNQKSEWDAFIKKAKNGYFLFLRDFMDYHSHRFQDHSLMCYNEKDDLIAVLPANIRNCILYSHQGLTFGGFITSEQMSSKIMLEIFVELINYLKSQEVQKLVYKCIPAIYHRKPAEEDLYALFRNDAVLTRRDMSSTIFLNEKMSYSSGHKWGINKARKAGIEIRESSDFISFWQLLEEILQAKHQVSPIHSAEEIVKLATLFPDHIKLYAATLDNTLLAGCVIFEDKQIAHSQYMANSSAGRQFRALDLLIHHLLSRVYAHKKYFDFGVSTENDGQYLNEGLIGQKEEFGASAIVHDFYEITIKEIS